MQKKSTDYAERSQGFENRLRVYAQLFGAIENGSNVFIKITKQIVTLK